MSDDLVSGLLSAIEQREQAAVRALVGHPSKTDVADNPPRWSHRYHEVVQVDDDPDTEHRLTPVADCGRGNVFRAQHIEMNDPRSVLRLCRAHRKIIERYQVAAERIVELRRTGAAATEIAHVAGRYQGLRQVVEGLAEGYGLTEENNDE